MFPTIYQYELKHWFKQPSTYFYMLFFFAISFVTMWGMASESNFDTGKIMNSAISIHSYASKFLTLVLFVIPGIIGLSVYRDYKNDMHALFYSFPFSKWDYLSAKFLSAFTVVMLIASMVLLGFAIGFQIADVSAGQLLPFDIRVYAQEFFVYIFPNFLFYAALIFAAVTFTRNIYFGYIALVILIILRQMMVKVLSALEQEYLAVLLDPNGGSAIKYLSSFWTINEQNQNYLPIHGVVIYNRLIWISMAVLILLVIYKSFSFRQNAISFSFKKIKKQTLVKSNFGSICKVNLPKVEMDFSIQQQMKTMCRFAWIEFKYIVSNWMFISIVVVGAMAVIFIISSANPRFGTKTLPITAEMLMLPSMFFSGIINLLTFLYAGMLIHRAKIANANQLVDISPISNWVFLSSKFLAIVMMQIVLLSLLMFGGIFNQILQGYYHFEIGHYLFELYGLSLIHFVIWAFLAVFIQSLFNNPFLGFFILVLLTAGMIFLPNVAHIVGMPFLEEAFFRFNQAPGAPPFWLMYSDMGGYSPMMETYLVYKAYWFLGGVLFFLASYLFWKRGLTYSFSERLAIARMRMNKGMIVFASFISIAFLVFGFGLYSDGFDGQEKLTEEQRRDVFRAAEKKYKHYNYIVQPKIKSISINMDIFPETRDFKATGKYFIINESQEAIDTLMLSYLPGVNTTYDFNQKFEIISQENIANYIHIDLLKLNNSLHPGDSLQMNFSAHNNPNTLMHRSALVKKNGTFIEDDIFPQFGNWLNFIRVENNWSTKNLIPHPSDSTAWNSKNLDRINFEATVSTSADQRAFTTGDLQKEWTENGRNYFHYKMNQAIPFAFLFMSGEYDLRKDKWKEVDLEIYSHKDHPYNIDRIMAGKKDALEYCSKNFSPFQFNHLRTIEFSQTGGASAHGFPGTIPTGEGAGFIADIKDEENGGIDFAYGTAVHEVGHMWWGNQLQAADVLGGKMLIESLAEYVNVMVKKHQKGKKKYHKYLAYNRKVYLTGRTSDRMEEQPLMYCYPGQKYIYYPKGAIIFATMSDYIGEENLNRALRQFIQQVNNKEIPSTSIELVQLIQQETPDSLKYLIEDLFETITLYENSVLATNVQKLPNGKYQVDIEFLISKYRSKGRGVRHYQNEQGDSLTYSLQDNRQANGAAQAVEKAVHLFSYPLADYIDIAIFSESKINGELQEKELYLQKHKITKIHNKLSFIIDQKPSSIGIDPYLKLMDTNDKDNRRKL